jgi:hypothetical protein
LVNNYRYLEDRLVLVPVAVILVSMAEISWDFLARGNGQGKQF